MRSDHLRSTDRGIRQVSRLPQTSEATAEADAEPQIQIGAGRQGPSEPCRLLTKASQNCTRVLALKSHGQSLEEPFRLSCNTFIGSGRDGCSQLLPGLGGNGPPATGASFRNQWQKLKPFSCASGQSVEVLVLPVLVGRGSTATIGCGCCSLSCRRPQVTAKSKAAGPSTPQEGTPDISWAATAVSTG